MSETFTFYVGYSTTFEDLERLREKMLEFVTQERRDYETVFDVKVKGRFSMRNSWSFLNQPHRARLPRSGKNDPVSRYQVQEQWTTGCSERCVVADRTAS